MTDYNPILATETDPDAPLRSSLFKRMVANPIALAEGATGAPRIHPAALDTYRGRISLSGTTPASFTGLHRYKALRLDVGIIAATAGATQSNNLEVSYSSDGGSTWGSWQSTGATVTGSSTPSDRRSVMGFLYLDLTNGAYNGRFVRAGSETSATIAVAIGTHGVPANCNAVRFRLDGGSATGNLDAVGLSGVQA